VNVSTSPRIAPNTSEACPSRPADNRPCSCPPGSVATESTCMNVSPGEASQNATC